MNTNSVNIAIAIDDKYIFPALVMMHSLLEKTGSNIDLFLLYTSLCKENRDKLRKQIESFDGKYHEIYIDQKLFNKATLNDNPDYSIEIYYRIMLPYLATVDKILWIDADTVVRGNIRELYDNDISNVYVAACIDIGEEHNRRNEIKGVLQISDQVYFNSGVLLMNAKKIREEIPKELFFDLIGEFNNVLVCPDQDILNKALGMNYLLLPTKYNFQYHYDHEACKLVDEAVIVHYTWRKPWNKNYDGYLDETYWEAAIKAGFFREYKKYRSAKLYRLAKERVHEYWLWFMRKCKM